jgi:hypothetical protein
LERALSDLRQRNETLLLDADLTRPAGEFYQPDLSWGGLWLHGR